MLLGLPFLRVSDIPTGLTNIEKASLKLTHPKCKQFASGMISYLKKTWMKHDLESWNVFMVQTRTNNQAEAYNRAIGSKCKPHPNPYTLVSIIKDELGNTIYSIRNVKIAFKLLSF